MARHTYTTTSATTTQEDYSDLAACMATGTVRKHRHAAHGTHRTNYTPATRTHSMAHTSHHTPTHATSKYTAQSSSAWGEQHYR